MFSLLQLKKVSEKPTSNSLMGDRIRERTSEIERERERERESAPLLAMLVGKGLDGGASA